MKNHSTMGLGVSTLVLTAAIGFATPAAAEEETFEMPDVVGATLADAQSAVTSLSDETPLTLEAEPVGYAQDELVNGTNWIVCEQSPEADEEIAADSELSVVVARPSGCE